MAAETPVAKYGNLTFPNAPLERHSIPSNLRTLHLHCIFIVIQSNHQRTRSP